MASWKIVEITPETYEVCKSIWDIPPEKHAQLLQDLQEGKHKIFACLAYEKWLGAAAMVYDNGDRVDTIPGQRVCLARLLVRDQWRQQGVGGALVDCVLKQAHTEGFPEISLGVYTDNIPARRLYEKKGFTTLLFHGEDKLGEYVKLLKYLKEPQKGM